VAGNEVSITEQGFGGLEQLTEAVVQEPPEQVLRSHLLLGFPHRTGLTTQDPLAQVFGKQGPTVGQETAVVFQPEAGSQALGLHRSDEGEGSGTGVKIQPTPSEQDGVKQFELDPQERGVLTI